MVETHYFFLELMTDFFFLIFPFLKVKTGLFFVLTDEESSTYKSNFYLWRKWIRWNLTTQHIITIIEFIVYTSTHVWYVHMHVLYICVFTCSHLYFTKWGHSKGAGFLSPFLLFWKEWFYQFFHIMTVFTHQNNTFSFI